MRTCAEQSDEGVYLRRYTGGRGNVLCGRGVDVTDDEDRQRCEAREFHSHSQRVWWVKGTCALEVRG